MGLHKSCRWAGRSRRLPKSRMATVKRLRWPERRNYPRLSKFTRDWFGYFLDQRLATKRSPPTQGRRVMARRATEDQVHRSCRCGGRKAAVAGKPDVAAVNGLRRLEHRYPPRLSRFKRRVCVVSVIVGGVPGIHANLHVPPILNILPRTSGQILQE